MKFKHSIFFMSNEKFLNELIVTGKLVSISKKKDSFVVKTKSGSADVFPCFHCNEKDISAFSVNNYITVKGFVNPIETKSNSLAFIATEIKPALTYSEESFDVKGRTYEFKNRVYTKGIIKSVEKHVNSEWLSVKISIDDDNNKNIAILIQNPSIFPRLELKMNICIVGRIFTKEKSKKYFQNIIANDIGLLSVS